MPLGRAVRKRVFGDGMVLVGRSLAASEVGAENANRRAKMREKVMNVKRGMEIENN